MEERLARHLLRRLRRSQERAAINHAVELGILAESTHSVDGFQLRAFAPGFSVMEKSDAEIARLLRRGGRATGGRLPVENDDDGGFSPAVLFAQGARDLVTAAGLTGKKPAATTASAGTSGALQGGRKELTRKLLSGLRETAPPPFAADVATLLLVSQALTDSRVSLEEVLHLLRLRQPIVTVTCPVKGFEDKFIELLRRGFVLPGLVAICSGYDLTRASSFRFDPARHPKWRTVVFAAREFEPDQSDTIRKQVGYAAQSAFPILGVAERVEDQPEHLRKAAQLNLSCGPLSMLIIQETMRAVLGKVSEGGISSRACSVLTLSDLALAIRPGVSTARALDLLEELADIRMRFEAAETDGGRDGGKSGKDNSQKSTSSSFSKSTRGNPGAGSERIEPEAVTGTCRDRFIPRIETLTGYGEARDWALGLKEDLALWRQGRLGWDEMSVKLLLSGPPGTGKTTFARALCNTLQIPLIVTSVATWLEPGYLSDVIIRMRTAFAEAAAANPSILFIDEIDGIGSRGRSRDYDDYWNSVVNRLLELLDGAAKTSGVIVVGATNNPGIIDPALLRSGRLEKHIPIPMPDTEALIGILRHHLKNDLEAIIASAPARATDPDAADFDKPLGIQSRETTSAQGAPTHGDV